MPEESYLITAIAVMMVITYMTRALPLLVRMEKTPKLFDDVIDYLPVAIIASITIPGLLISQQGELMPLNADMLSALPVAVVAWLTRSLIYSVGTGIAAHILLTLYA